MTKNNNTEAPFPLSLSLEVTMLLHSALLSTCRGGTALLRR
jgi:hypothetical protein